MKVLVTEEKIREAVERLGKKISEDFKDEEHLLIIPILKGAFVFAADLIREINRDVEVEFVRSSSYVNTESSGKVKTSIYISTDVKNKTIILVEDIVETGITLENLTNILLSSGAKDVRICALLDKPMKRKVEIDVDYIGIEIPDSFVVGYGLDYNNKYRNLKDICILDEESK